MRILIVEDDPHITSFVIKGLKEAGYAVSHCEDGLKGLHEALSQEYDLLIIDIMLPGLDGFSLIERVRQSGKITPILILSAKRSVEDRVQGLNIGSDDYLVKPFAFSELLARVQALLRRSKGYKEPTKLIVADLVLDLVKREADRRGNRFQLSHREFTLLEYLMRNAGRILTRTQIINHVWGYNFDPGTNVVDVHICRLRDKIDKGFDRKLIHTIRGAGYILKDED